MLPLPFLSKRFNLATAALDAVSQSQIVVQFSTDRRIIWCNDLFLEVTGYSRAEAMGMPHSCLVPLSDARSEEYEEFWKSLCEGQYSAGNFRRVSKDRQDLWLQATYNPVLNAIGGVHSILKIATDLTDATVTRAEADAKLKAIDRSHCILEIDPAGPILEANENFLKVVGKRREEVVGKTLSSFVSAPIESELPPNEFRSRLRKGQRVEGMHRIVRSDGRELLLEASFSSILDPEGRSTRILYLGNDITHSSQIKSALEKAQVAVKAKASFLAHMSHEVRTPMAGVMGFAEMLLASDLTDKQRQQVALIHESGTKMMALLNDILDVSKIEAGQMRLVREPVDLRHVLKSCVSLMAPIAEQKSLRLDLEVDESLPRAIYGDILRLRQIVLNLVGNAVKFTGTGGVRVEARRCKGVADKFSVTVSDTGIGIEEHLIEQVLSKFGQADQSVVRSYGGSGLGLTISKELTELMGGEFAISSTPGEGTRIELQLPLERVDMERASLPQQGVDGTGRTWRDDAPRVLVAEDHDINQMLISQQLDRIGVRIEIAQNGREAIEMVERECAGADPFRLVFMDLQMPGMGGLEAAAAIREAGLDEKDLPILALTANAYADDITACMDAGMQGHIAKPTAIAALAEAMERWIPRRAKTAAPTPAVTKEQTGSSLKARYEARRDETLHELAELARQGDCCVERADRVAQSLHKLAGTAGLFGQKLLGDEARRFETALRQADADRLPEVLAQAHTSLHAAA